MTARNVVIVLQFSSLMWIYLYVEGAQDHIGKEFIFGMPENSRTTNYPFLLHVTTPKTTEVVVEISTPRTQDSIVYLSSNFTVSAPKSEIVSLHPFYTAVTGTTLSTKAIYVKASDDIVVYCINIIQYSNDGFIVYPLDAIGNEYYTISYYPSTKECQFMIVATENDTNVVIEYPRNPGINVTFYNNTFGSGDIQTISLQKFDILQIQDNADLTGTHILADKNIVVISGNKFTTINPLTNDTENIDGDNLVEQLSPVNTWGKEFGFVATPNRSTGDIIKFVGSENDTSIFLQCSDGTETTLTVDTGTHAQYHTPSDVVCHVISSKPIMVNLFVVSMLNESDPGDPSLLSIVPFKHYSHDHRIPPLFSYTGTYQTYFLYIIHEDEVNGLRIDGEPLLLPNYKKIPDTPYVGGYARIEYENIIIYHNKTNVYFGGYVYCATKEESLMMATGLRLSPINTPCEPTLSEFGDGIDNDCDGEIDEDICDDADHIRKMGDDCARVTPIDGGFSSWSGFTKCSNQCGKGYKTRYRTCTNPTPQYWGANCTGQYTQYVTCYGLLPCPIDGTWSAWKVSTCSRTCGNGTYYMYRVCDNPKPDYGGADCVGEPAIVGVCNDMNCNGHLRAGISSMNSCPPLILQFKTGLLEITIWILHFMLTTRLF